MNLESVGVDGLFYLLDAHVHNFFVLYWAVPDRDPARGTDPSLLKDAHASDVGACEVFKVAAEYRRSTSSPLMGSGAI